MKHNFFLLLLLLSIGISAKAQLFFNDGYIILNDKNRLEGKIKQIDYKTIAFMNEKGIVTYYSVSNVSEYVIENIPFVSKSLIVENSLQNVFLKKILVGKISFYEIPKINEKARFVIENEDGSMTVLNKENAAAEMRKLIYVLNNPALLLKTTKEKFSYSESYIRELIKEFNLETYPNQEMKTFKKTIIVSPQLFVGAAANSFYYTGFYDNIFISKVDKTPAAPSIPVGIGLSFNPQKTLSFGIEVFYNQTKGDNILTYYNFFNSTYLQDHFYFKENTIAIPMNLKFTFLQRPFQSYIKFGPKYVFEVPVEGYADREIGFKTQFFWSNHKYGIGYNASIGIEKKWSKKIYSTFEYRFAQHFVHEGSTKILNSNSHQLVLGLGVFN